MTQIDEYINKHFTSALIIKGGLKYLIDSWKSRVDIMPLNHQYLLEEYIGVELGKRSCIQEILQNCDVPRKDRVQIAEIDASFKEKTISLDVPISFSYQDIFADYDNSWFFYRVPHKYIKDELFLRTLLSYVEDFNMKEFPVHHYDIKILDRLSQKYFGQELANPKLQL